MLHSTNADVETFAEALTARAGIDPSKVSVNVVAASIGPHVGPGCVGAVALYKKS